MCIASLYSRQLDAIWGRIAVPDIGKTMQITACGRHDTQMSKSLRNPVLRPMAAQRYAPDMHVTLYQPEIAGNVGAVMRSCACFGAGLTLIEPCGFPLGDKRMRRAAMDYAVPGGFQTAQDWDSYHTQASGRQVLLTTKGAMPLPDFAFNPDDTLIFGAEGSGVPDFVHESVDARVVIPMVAGARSLNLSNSVAVTLFEAMRQTNSLP